MSVTRYSVVGTCGGRCHEVEPVPDGEFVEHEAYEALSLQAALALDLLKEARKIIRASSSRQLAKDWDRRTTEALADATGRASHG
jgi:hypothetical protein